LDGSPASAMMAGMSSFPVPVWPSIVPALFLVDVFAEREFGGNQLAVVVGAPVEEWPTERMQAFAREMNFSETTFASPSPSDGAFDVRIFTPAAELPFAGHPTLGTAWVLQRFFHEGAPSELKLRSRIGEIAVEFDDGAYGELVRMRPRTPDLGAAVDAATMASHLSLAPSDIDAAHPCQLVSIGVAFVVVPVTHLVALRRARAVSLPLGEDGQPVFVLAYCMEPYEPGADVAARMFFDANGIREDPATGSAAACLAAYLASRRVFGSRRLRARVQQGYEVDRPSCLYIGASEDGGELRVDVAGKVRLVAQGRLG
jgi:trans-2,3-dihydro-3-hydroxyanthranilate isomerase